MVSEIAIRYSSLNEPGLRLIDQLKQFSALFVPESTFFEGRIERSRFGLTAF